MLSGSHLMAHVFADQQGDDGNQQGVDGNQQGVDGNQQGVDGRNPAPPGMVKTL